jgi:hypothetical protein
MTEPIIVMFPVVVVVIDAPFAGVVGGSAASFTHRIQQGLATVAPEKLMLK